MTTPHICAWPDCEKEATFPAPKDPRDLSARQYFCQEHIKIFNKKWNGMDGFSEEEILKIQDGDATWQRPTWTIGSNPTGPSTYNFESADDLFEFFNKRRVAPPKPEAEEELPLDVQEACLIMELEKPLPKTKLKHHYHDLVKAHHPDLHEGASEAEEHLKKINVAYKILTDWASKDGC